MPDQEAWVSLKKSFNISSPCHPRVTLLFWLEQKQALERNVLSQHHTQSFPRSDSAAPHVHLTLMPNCIAPTGTQKLREELSAVTRPSCSSRSWHKELATLPFAVLVIAPSTACGSRDMLSGGCGQTAVHGVTGAWDAKRS